jgi:molecular chaperone GrpE
MSGKRHREPAPGSDAERTAAAEAGAAAADLEAAALAPAPAEAAAAALAERAAVAQAQALAEANEALIALADERERLLRLLAERDNQVKRVQRDLERDALRQRGELALLLLPILDDFERALAQLPAEAEAGSAHADGLRLIAQRFQELLAAFGLTPIAALGERFDPRVHEAVVQLPGGDAEKGTVIQELQRGYRLGELLIRPAKVAVAG